MSPRRKRPFRQNVVTSSTAGRYCETMRVWQYRQVSLAFFKRMMIGVSWIIAAVRIASGRVTRIVAELWHTSTPFLARLRGRIVQLGKAGLRFASTLKFQGSALTKVSAYVASTTTVFWYSLKPSLASLRTRMREPRPLSLQVVAWLLMQKASIGIGVAAALMAHLLYVAMILLTGSDPTSSLTATNAGRRPVTSSASLVARASADPFSFLEKSAVRRVVYYPSREFQPPSPRAGGRVFHSIAGLGAEFTPLPNIVRGYASRTAISPNSPLKLFLASTEGGGVSITSHRVIEATTNKEILFEQYQQPLFVKHATCKSYNGKGCEYPTNVEIRLPSVAQGVYYILFEQTESPVSEPLYFIVRPEPPSAGQKRVAVVYPENTWQAYNAEGGKSFYTVQRPDLHFEISLHRPVPTAIGAAYHNARGTIPFVRELKQMNIEPLQLTNLDLHEFREYARAIDVLILTAHDEYWSAEMRDFVEDLLQAGGKVAVFSGNVMWWKVNIRQGRIFINQLDNRDSIESDYTGTGYWFRPWIDRPVAPILGLTYFVGGIPVGANLSLEEAIERGLSRDAFRSSRQIRVVRPEHPIFEGTGLKTGDRFGGVTSLLDVELDSALLRGDGEIDNTTKTKFPPSLKVLGTGLLIDPSSGSSDGLWPNRILHSAIIAELEPHIGGRVMHFGSIGWYGPLDAGEPHVVRIFRNTVQYLRSVK